MTHKLITLLMIGLLTACSGMDTTTTNAVNLANEKLIQTGSPYRWSSKSVGNGSFLMEKELIGNIADSSADKELQQHIISQLQKLEANATTINVIEIRLINVVDGKEINEVWLIERGNENKVAYVVNMQTVATGGTNTSISGPW